MTNSMLLEMGKLARRAHCYVDLRPDGRFVIRRGTHTLTGPLASSAAMTWLNGESQRFIERKAKAKLEAAAGNNSPLHRSDRRKMSQH